MQFNVQSIQVVGAPAHFNCVTSIFSEFASLHFRA